MSETAGDIDLALDKVHHFSASGNGGLSLFDFPKLKTFKIVLYLMHHEDQ